MRSYHKFSSKLFMLTFRNICIIHEVAFNNILNLVTLIPNTDIRPIRHRNIDIPKINYITLSINLRQFRISNPFELIRAHIGFSFHCKYPPPLPRLKVISTLCLFHIFIEPTAQRTKLALGRGH